MSLEIRTVSRDEMTSRLSGFETMHAHVHGATLDSAEFYELFRRGEYDSPFAMAWATCYEVVLSGRTAVLH